MNLNDIEELHPFVRDGQLVVMPRKRAKRLILLNALAQLFEPGRHYREAEVNKALSVVSTTSYVALRRYLVEYGFLDRRDGEYWRCGGTVD